MGNIVQAPHFYDRGPWPELRENRHEEASCCWLATVAALTASPVFAAARHHNRAPERPAIGRLNCSNLYQSDAQGNQPYPNPDRQLYVPEYDF